MNVEIEKEIEKVKEQINTLSREINMLDQAKQEKVALLLQSQGVFNFLTKLSKEETK